MIKLFTWYLQRKGYLVVEPCDCGGCDCREYSDKSYDHWTDDELADYRAGYNTMKGSQLKH